MKEIPWAYDKWFGLDKLNHLCASFTLTAILDSVLLWPVAAGLALAGGLIWEWVEWFRYEGWDEKVQAGYLEPRPEVCDEPSYKDVVWNTIGIILAVWL